MHKVFILIIIFFVTIGCVATSKHKKPAGPTNIVATPILKVEVKPLGEQESTKLKEIVSEDSQPIEQEIKTGNIFAKMYFEGVVKTSYIQLSIVDKSDENKAYELYIGDKEKQKDFPWEIQKVSPGYFFIELLPGAYKFRKISIPVGSSVATEKMDIDFEVGEGKIYYLGTLKVVGTKEKIKLGGVPVIKPGFEYSVELLNEHEEAFNEFNKHFPDLNEEVEIKLMNVNLKDNIEKKLKVFKWSREE